MTKPFLTAVLALLLCSNTWARDKTDVIWLSNGDRLTGEIKQLEHGRLRLSTDSFGEVFIEWDDIERFESDYAFQFERTDGRRMTGVVENTDDQKGVTLVSGRTSVSFSHENIVRIAQIEDNFWEQLKGSLSFGYSFTKASDVAQGNLAFRATHRTEIRSFLLDGSTIITSDSVSEDTQRSDLGFTMTRFRANRWFNSYKLGFESNDELNLDLRTSLTAGFGRYLIQTNRSELALLTGLVGTSERLQEDSGAGITSTSTQENLEGLLGVEYSRYIYDQPKVNLASSLSVFPSITDSGRTRAQLDVDLKWEVISDLFWNLNFYNTYDSQPPEGSTATSDYGVVTSLGWSF